MATHTVMLPYRDVNNRDLKYAPAPAPAHLQQQVVYDSDAEPLITSNPDLEPTSDALLRFTATGQPLPATKFRGLQSLAGDMYSLPNLLPKQYTDDSIIPAIIVNVIPSSAPPPPTRRRSWITRLKTGMPADKGKGDGRITKVVYMPRGEYLRWFARDKEGAYIGTEEKREWTEEQLDEKFGKYQPAVCGKKRYTGVV